MFQWNVMGLIGHSKAWIFSWHNLLRSLKNIYYIFKNNLLNLSNTPTDFEHEEWLRGLHIFSCRFKCISIQSYEMTWSSSWQIQDFLLIFIGWYWAWVDVFLFSKNNYLYNTYWTNKNHLFNGGFRLHMRENNSIQSPPTGRQSRFKYDDILRYNHYINFSF